MGQKKVKVAAEARIFNLVLALVASPNGLTRDQLLSTVYGYSNDYAFGADNTSLNRKFERDKSQLKLLGIPVETLDSPGSPGNNQLTRYRISKSGLQLPEGTTFTDDELQLLRAAALAWSDTSLSPQSRQAVMKLESIRSLVDTSQLGIAPKVYLQDPAITNLLHAIHSGSRVIFNYMKPADLTVETRTVSPFRLHRADGRWLLIAYDHDRADWRSFLISRISGKVSVFAATAADLKVSTNRTAEATKVIDQLKHLQSSQPAEVVVLTGSTAHMNLRPRSIEKFETDTTLLTFNTLDYDALAEELVSFVNGIISLQPKKLNDLVLNKLEEIKKLHRPEATNR